MHKRTIAVLLVAIALASVGAAQKNQPPTTGGLKGKVRVDSGSTPGGVGVVLRRGEEEVAHAETDAKGQFELRGVAPGQYTLTLRKPGLKTAQIRPVEIRAGKVGSLPERVFLPADEGSLAFVMGSVFDPDGRSVRGARIEIALVGDDGSARKVDGRVTTESGQFSFQLQPRQARYRLTAKADGGLEATKEVEVDSAMVYRVALTLRRGGR
jgi:hypothetical protein